MIARIQTTIQAYALSTHTVHASMQTSILQVYLHTYTRTPIQMSQNYPYIRFKWLETTLYIPKQISSSSSLTQRKEVYLKYTALLWNVAENKSSHEAETLMHLILDFPRSPVPSPSPCPSPSIAFPRSVICIWHQNMFALFSIPSCTYTLFLYKQVYTCIQLYTRRGGRG